ncbi:hypothetical protein SLA2020_382820 [Shorea laevis]
MTSNVTKGPLGKENLGVMRLGHIEVSMLVMAFAAFVLFVSGSSRRRGYCGGYYIHTMVKLHFSLLPSVDLYHWPDAGCDVSK